MNDSVLLSESLTGPTIAACLLAALHLRERPGAGRALLLGALIGLAALNRSEAILLVLLLGVPAVLPARSVKLAALLCLASVLTIAPWVIRNAVTFERSTFLTTGDGSVLRGANCDSAYRGQRTGDGTSAASPATAWRGTSRSSRPAGETRRWTTRATTSAACPWWSRRGSAGASASTRPRRQVAWLEVHRGPPANAGVGRRWRPTPPSSRSPWRASPRCASASISLPSCSHPSHSWCSRAPPATASWRFRQPAEVSFVVLAGIGLTWMMGRRRHA